MTYNYLQKALFENVLNKFPKKADAVRALSDLLAVGRDGIYRRLRGETQLTPEELFQLTRHFGVSLDSIVYDSSDMVIFSYSLFSRKIASIQDYLDMAYEQANHLKELPGVTLYAAAQEIPVFLYGMFPELFKFKMYVYGNTHWELPYLQDNNFSFDLIDAEAVDMATQIGEIYVGIPSFDLWGVNIINNSLKQIEYMHTIGKIEEKEQALRLCDTLIQLIQYVRDMATEGKKFSLHKEKQKASADFQLFYNDFSSNNDATLVFSHSGSYFYTTFGTPDFLQTSDEHFCDHQKEWFEKSMRRATPISKNSDKSRSWFFTQMQRKVELTKTRIEMMHSETEL